MKDPYDVLLAIRLDADYEPEAAGQIPREIVELIYTHGTRTSFTAKLVASPSAVLIPKEQLVEAARRVGAAEAPRQTAPTLTSDE